MPAAPAFFYGNHWVSYEALANTLAQATVFVAEQGVRSGMLAGIETSDHLLHIVLILACEANGAGTLSLTGPEARGGAEGLAYCDILFAAGTDSAHPRQVRLDAGTIGAITSTTLPDGWRSVLAGAPPPPAVARVLGSSGTTGTPKPIVLGPEAMAAILCHRCDLIERFGSDAAVFVCLYGPAFDRAMTFVRAMLCLGRMVAFGFDGWAGAEAVPTWFGLALPGQVRLVGQAFQASGLARRAAFLDINGAAIDPRTHDLAVELLADRVVVNYGMKEATGISWVDREGVGTLCPGVQVRVAHDPALPMSGHEAGVIEVRAPTVARAYLGHPDLSAARFADGWFRTGDIGFQPAPDRLVVLGRADDVLNVGGEKLVPGPLEAALCSDCGVDAVALITMPDADGVERLVVLIECDDTAADAETRTRIAALVSARVGTVRLEFVRELPRNEAGKVRRGALQALVGNETPAAAASARRKR